MRIIILGGGVIGVTTAFWLARDGHEVTVLERGPTVGLETSYANGAQLSASETLPWAGPEVFKRVLKWLFGQPSPFTVRLKADPGQWRWLLSFLWHCTPQLQRRGLMRNLPLACYSIARLSALYDEFANSPGGAPQIDWQSKGILRIFHSEQEFAAARIYQPLLASLGSQTETLNARQCVDIEPALADAVARLRVVGGIYAPDDKSADTHLFTQDLARRAQALGVTFMLNTTATGPGGIQESQGGLRARTLKSVRTSKGEMEADCFVLALGCASRDFARSLDLNLPVYPMKGYSLTLPANEAAPFVSITDEANRVVFSRLGERLRVAGIADVVGYDTSLEKRRIAHIERAIGNLFPKVPLNDVRTWAGLRPMTPDCGPVLGLASQGKTNWRNLYLNTGHGSLGWTMAAGSAAVTADLIGGRKPAIDQNNLALHRF